MAHESIKSIKVLCRDGLAGPGLEEIGPSSCEGLCESVCCPGQHSRLVRSRHQYVRGWGWGEKLAYGQSQCVTFGLEFTLGSDAHADELVRIVVLQRRRRVWRGGFSSLEATSGNCLILCLYKVRLTKG